MILWFFLSLLLISMVLLGWLLWPFFSVIVMGAVVTGLFSPLYRFAARRMSDGMASFVTCLIIFIVLFVPIVLFVTIISREAYDLYLAARGSLWSDEIRGLLQGSRLAELTEKNALFARIGQFLSDFGIELTGEEFQAAVADLGRKMGLMLYEQSQAIASNLLKLLLNFFFMLLVVYYLLIDGHRLVAFIVDLSPLPREQDEKLIRKFKDMAGAILVGNGLAGMFQGVLGGVVFALFGLNSPVLWGVVMAFLAFLPIVGIGAVLLPASLLLFLKGRIAAGIFFVVFYLVVSGGIEYLLKPRIVGKRVQMHTLLVFLSIMGGLKLFGILGIIYGPLVVTGFLTLTDIYYASYRKLVEPTNGQAA